MSRFRGWLSRQQDDEERVGRARRRLRDADAEARASRREADVVCRHISGTTDAIEQRLEHLMWARARAGPALAGAGDIRHDLMLSPE